MSRESSQSQVETTAVIDNQLSLPALTNTAGDEPALFYPPSPMSSLVNLERCTSNPLVRGYSNVSVTSDEGAHFIPFGRGQGDLLLPSPVPSPINNMNLQAFRFDAQTLSNPMGAPMSQENIPMNLQIPITPRPMDQIYVPSKVPLDPIADVSECEQESRTEPTERTYVSSQMTGTCSNAHSAVRHDDDDEAEPEGAVDIDGVTQGIADTQLNAEVSAFVPTNNNINNPMPVPPPTMNSTVSIGSQLSNAGFVTPNYIPFGLTGLPHPSQFSRPSLPQMQPLPQHNTTTVQGSHGYSDAVRNYMDSTQPGQAPQQPQGGSPNFTPHQNPNHTATYNNSRAYTAPPRRASPPRQPQTSLQAMSKCDDMIRVLENIHPSQDSSTATFSSHTALQRLLNEGLIMKFMTDQTGSRYLQQKLASAPTDIVGQILDFIVFQQKAIRMLSEEKYANYVIQMFFEKGTPAQLSVLMQHLLTGNVYYLSRHFYACRVIQKAMDHVSVDDCIAIIGELEAHGREVPNLIHDCILCDNGNHVIQKMLTLKLDRRHIKFIIDVVDTNLLFYSSQNYGCRIVQNIIEFYGQYDDKRVLRTMVARDNLLEMCQSQYGNYVIQRILKLCFGADQFLQLKRDVMRNVFASVERLSVNKYGSNVVESCVEHASDRQRQMLLDQILKGDCLVKMVRHKFGNYVVQKMLTLGSQKQVTRLVKAIESRIPPGGQRSAPYVKHIFAKINGGQVGGEGQQRRGGRGGSWRGNGQGGQQRRGGRGGRW